MQYFAVIKRYLFPFLFVATYLTLILTIFLGSESINDIGTTITLQIVLMMLALLALQSRDHRRYRQTNIIIIILMIINLIVAGLGYGISYMFFVSMIHIILLVFLRERRHLRISSKKVYLWRASHWGLHLVSVFLAIAYTGVIWLAGSTITIDCAELRNDTIGLMTQYIPDSTSSSNLQRIAQDIEKRGSQSIGQLLGIGSSHTTGSLSSTLSNNTLSTSLGGTTTFDGEIVSGDTITGNNTTGLITSLVVYQSNLINGIITNQELIDSQVCDITLSHIQNLINNNEVKLIGFILMILLLSVFLRSIFFVIGIVNFILLQLLFGLGWFKKTSHSEEVEDISI